MPVQWGDRFETGEARIDAQHQNLFTYVNRLEDLLMQARAGQELKPLEAKNLLIFLDAYVNTHFAYEELCVSLRKCPVALKNKEEHNRLLEFWTNFRRENALVTTTANALETLHDTLKGWLTNHICKIDLALRAKDYPALTLFQEGLDRLSIAP